METNKAIKRCKNNVKLSSFCYSFNFFRTALLSLLSASDLNSSTESCWVLVSHWRPHVGISLDSAWAHGTLGIFETQRLKGFGLLNNHQVILTCRCYGSCLGPPQNNLHFNQCQWKKMKTMKKKWKRRTSFKALLTLSCFSSSGH